MVQWLRADYDFEGFMTLSPMLSLFLLLWKRVNSPSNELPNINIASKPGHSPTCSLAVLQARLAVLWFTRWSPEARQLRTFSFDSQPQAEGE